MLLFYDKIFLEHDTGVYHPENIARLESVYPILKASSFGRGKISDYSSEFIIKTHSQGQFDQVKTLSLKGGLQNIDPDTIVSEASFAAAKKAAFSGMSAVDYVLSGGKRAFCAVRPPGHHATDLKSMGFCLFNNIAVAANYALKNHELDRVLIIDFDVHHGNGTQDIFYENENVFFMSMHRYPFYPGTGAEDESGRGKGLGFTLNIPTLFGTDRKQILNQFNKGLEKALKKIKPQLILISAGFDGHRNDPIGSLGLDLEDFSLLTKAIVSAANTFCNGNIVSILEGGYNLSALAESVKVHLESLK